MCDRREDSGSTYLKRDIFYTSCHLFGGKLKRNRKPRSLAGVAQRFLILPFVYLGNNAIYQKILSPFFNLPFFPERNNLVGISRIAPPPDFPSTPASPQNTHPPFS